MNQEIIEEIKNQDYTSGDLLTGFLKKELIDTITPIIVEHQKQRAKVTDDLVMEFMRPRSLNWGVSSASGSPVHHKLIKSGEPLSPGALDKLESHLAGHSYVHGVQFSEADLLVYSRLAKVEGRPNTDRWSTHISALLDLNGDAKPMTLTKEKMAEVKEVYGMKN